MNQTKWKKTLAWVVALTMCLALFPAALATGTSSDPIPEPHEEHVYNDEGLCEVCGMEKPDPCAEGHAYNDEGVCEVCGAEKPAPCEKHVYNDEGVCKVCGAEKPAPCEEHVYNDEGVCEVCGAEKPNPCAEGHTYNDEGVCEFCGAEKPDSCAEGHAYNDEGVCEVCGAEKPDDSEPAAELRYPEQVFSDAVPGMGVSVFAPEGALPEGTEMRLTTVLPETVRDAVCEKLNEEPVQIFAVDISFFLNGVEVQPLVPIQVKFNPLSVTGDEPLEVFHIDDETQEAEKLDQAGAWEAMSAEVAPAAGEVLVTADSFSG